ncbi:MAG: nucleoside monophosphate kinase [bacterium]|nr:nucleoside monophosphate kinase [bacterium]
MSPFVITIIGPPGSGKGTQGKVVAQKYNLNHIGVGDLVRQLIVLDTPLGKKAKDNYDKGVPQPDEIIIQAVKEKIEKMSASQRKKGFLFDTFLSFNQAKAFDEVLKNYDLPGSLAIYLNISADTVIERTEKRLICSKCGAVFLSKDPAYNTGKCDKCGGDLMVRSDDKPEVVRRRIEEYKSRMLDLKKYYQDRKRLIVINGEPAIEEIHKDIIKKINEFHKTK